MLKRKWSEDRRALIGSFPPGTVINTGDRKYIVSPTGSWRVLEYSPEHTSQRSKQ